MKMTKIHDNYANNYNLFQLALPLNVEAIVELDEDVKLFVDLMRKVNVGKYLKPTQNIGRTGYDPTTMLLLVLFAYTNQIFSLRKMEDACKYDIRFIGLGRGITPSHQAFQNFINDYLIDDINTIFYAINKEIINELKINTDVLYIDGTKFEANANKNSFVWKKAVLNYRSKLMLKITKFIIDYNEYSSSVFPIKDEYKPNLLISIKREIQKEINKHKIEFKSGKGQRKHPLQRYFETVEEYLSKMVEYDEKISICGPRNSYSKVDKDATFMNMKYDYYNKTGVFKPGYNLQIGVSDFFILHLDVFQNPNDTKTFIPFMESYKKHYLAMPTYPVGDAGYGSYDNFYYCKENRMALSLKYNYFNKVNNDKKFELKIFNALNFTKMGDTILCPKGYALHQIGKSKNTRSIFPKVDYIYECPNCNTCDVKTQCTKAKGNRQVRVNPIQDNFYKEVDTLLTSDYGQQLCTNRSIQVEGAFGVIKQSHQYLRLHRRTLPKVKMELMLVCIGFNIKKYCKQQRELKTVVFN